MKVPDLLQEEGKSRDIKKAKERNLGHKMGIDAILMSATFRRCLLQTFLRLFIARLTLVTRPCSTNDTF